METQRAERCSQNWDVSRILSRGVAPPQSSGTRWGRFEGIGSEGLSGRTVTGFTLVLTSLTPQRRMYGLNCSAAGSYLPKCSLQAFEIRNFRNENLEMTVLPETGYFLLSKALVILKTQFYCFNYLNNDKYKNRKPNRIPLSRARQYKVYLKTTGDCFANKQVYWYVCNTARDDNAGFVYTEINRITHLWCLKALGPLVLFTRLKNISWPRGLPRRAVFFLSAFQADTRTLLGGILGATIGLMTD